MTSKTNEVESLDSSTGPDTTRRGFQEGRLFLGGLNSQTTTETVEKYCSRWGHIIDAIVMENRGFGFVTFEHTASAQRFLETQRHEIDEKQIEAKAAIPRHMGGSTQLTKKMFVGGTGEIEDDLFRGHFEKYGEIVDAAIVRRDGVSRGFGFVTFKDEMSVEKCLVQGHVLPNGRKVDLKRAVPRDQIQNKAFSVQPRGLPMMPFPFSPMHLGMGPYGMHGYGIPGVHFATMRGSSNGPVFCPPY